MTTNQSTDLKDLIELAHQAKQSSYSPYSKFRVGCALVTKSGKVITGEF